MRSRFRSRVSTGAFFLFLSVFPGFALGDPDGSETVEVKKPVKIAKRPDPAAFAPIVAEKDRQGLIRDTKYFVAYQFATIAILYAMPESVTNWTDEQRSEYELSIWWDHVTHPQVDSDEFYLNAILHPYWGASYYVRAQERGYAPAESFWYSFLCSSIYEFGAEALAEEPSIQDIFVTPIGGTLVGTVFMQWRQDVRKRTMARGYQSRGDKWIWVLTDPLGALNRTFDRWFGWEADIRIEPYAKRQMVVPSAADGESTVETEWEAGVLIRARW